MLSPKTLIVTRREALRLKTGKVLIQQAWTRSTYFIHAGAYKSLFASLAVSTQSKTLHITTRLLLSFCMYLGKFIDTQTHMYVYIHTHKTQAKDAAKKKMKGVLLFPFNSFMLFPWSKCQSLSWFFFSFVKVRNWKQHCSQAEPSWAMYTDTFLGSFEPPNKICRKTVGQQEAFISSGDNRHFRILRLKRSRL